MKRKNGAFKRVLIATMAAVCALSSAAAISASAASTTIYGTTSSGYRVSSTATYSGKKVTGKGSVVSGGPCSIQVHAYGYYTSGTQKLLSCETEDKRDNTQTLEISATGNYTLSSAKCVSKFNSATTVTATV